MNPSRQKTTLQAVAILAIVLAAVSIMVGTSQGKFMSVGPIGMVVIVISYLWFRR